nr:metallopeptidase TldD-related protein [Rhodoferax sp.]
MNLQHIAEQALAALKSEGADASQATVSTSALTELNITHSEPSLLRSTQNHRFSLVGIWDGRKASTDLSDLSLESLTAAARALRGDAAAAPQDTAHAVSSGQHTAITRGPMEADLSALADAAHDVLDFRAKATPTMNIEEGAVSHTRADTQMLTSGGSHLQSSLGWYGVSMFGTARGPGPDGQVRTSSFNDAGGQTEDLRGDPAHSRFGIADMMRELTRSIVTQGVADCFGGKFVGDVVLTPGAVATLLGWLHGQVGDMALISGSSMYRDKVGDVVASPLLNLASRFDAPGIAAMSDDGFVAPPLQLLQAGRLQALTPSLYGSRKTGLAHVPTASGGWELAAGSTPLADIVRGVPRGAVVGRLSMGKPAANGDFSGIIKNSFAIDGGVVGTALSETMINGNVAQMLRDVVAVSAERIDTGGWCMPWVGVSGLHFS